MSIQGTVLHGGEAAGELLVLDEPLSFWGGFDPQTGEIIDQHQITGKKTGDLATGLVRFALKQNGGGPPYMVRFARHGNLPLTRALVGPTSMVQD